MALTASGPSQALTASSSQVNEFRAAFELAYLTVPSTTVAGPAPPPGVPANGGPSAASVTGSPAVAANAAYLSSGFALVDANCHDYFSAEGRLQQNVNVFRDLANVLLPLVSGGLALGTTSSKAGAIVALVGAAGNGALSAVYRDFLFDASNIDDVRQLVTEALAVHEAQVRRNMAEPGTTITFDWTGSQILAHQAICQPAHILRLARQAIGNGNLVATNAGAQNQGDAPRVPQSPPGAATNPPPASRVVVSVAPSGSVAAAVTQTVTYRRGTNAAAFDRCLYPNAVGKAADGARVDSSGTAVAMNPAKARALASWLARTGYTGGNGAFLNGGGTEQQLAAAYAAVCGR